jgi:hypothetical protein
MMKKYIFICLVISAFFLTSCFPTYEKGSGVIITEEVDVKAFDKIEIKGAGTVYYQQSDIHSLTIVTDDNILPYLTTDIKGDELILGFDKALINPSKLDYYISSPDIHSFKIAGSGDVITEKIITTDELKVWISGSGDAKMDLKAAKLEIKVSGSGDISTSGFVQELDMRINGSGSLDAYNTIIEKAKVNISGSGSASLHVTQNLRAKVSGSGNVEYKGNPKVNTNISGSGSVNSID